VGANIIALCNLQPSQSLSFHRSWTSWQASFHIFALFWRWVLHKYLKIATSNLTGPKARSTSHCHIVIIKVVCHYVAITGVLLNFSLQLVIQNSCYVIVLVSLIPLCLIQINKSKFQLRVYFINRYGIKLSVFNMDHDDCMFQLNLAVFRSHRTYESDYELDWTLNALYSVCMEIEIPDTTSIRVFFMVHINQ
jgi:hypothetical protein